jgi:hypothetical protein
VTTGNISSCQWCGLRVAKIAEAINKPIALPGSPYFQRLPMTTILLRLQPGRDVSVEQRDQADHAYLPQAGLVGDTGPRPKLYLISVLSANYPRVIFLRPGREAVEGQVVVEEERGVAAWRTDLQLQQPASRQLRE